MKSISLVLKMRIRLSLREIDVTKNFNYSDEVTFVAATYNNLGALTSIALKKAYGDSNLQSVQIR